MTSWLKCLQAGQVFCGAIRALGRSASLRWALPLALAQGLVLSAPTLALASIEGELAFHQGVAAYGKADYERAQARFEAALAADPKNASALHYLGLIAVRRGDPQGAIEFLERAVAIDRDATNTRIDLGAQLLKLGRDDEAVQQFQAVLAQEPEHPRTLLYSGIALYRAGRYAEALTPLQRAVELDPKLTPEGNYYIGLLEAFRGNLVASAAAFRTVEGASPHHPLGSSATTLRRQIVRSDRRWSAALTAGFEYNDNVTLAPDEPLPIDPEASKQVRSPAGVARLQGQVQALDTESFSWRVGYDGYFRIHTKEDARFLDQQTHLGWTHATYTTKRMSVSLRYDFSFTALDRDLKDYFRTIHRVSPTLYFPVGNWGLMLGYYQFLNYHYDIELVDEAFDRSGPQHTVGLQQFLFPPEPFNFVVLGGLLTRFDADGSEFRHYGFELSAGAELELFWGLEAGLLYRFDYRNYWEVSRVEQAITSNPDSQKKRLDREHTVSLNLDRAFGNGLTASIAGSYINNSSNIDAFDIDRFIIGTYLTYAF